MAFFSRNMMAGVLLCCFVFFLPTGCEGFGHRPADEKAPYVVDTIVAGLDHPWGMVFLPGNGNLALVTERPGRLNLVDIDMRERREITGLPEIAVTGQGGLLDVALHPEFETNHLVYLSYSASGDNRAQYATHVSRARLDADGAVLTDLELLLVAKPFSRASAHFGSRLVFDDDHRLYITSGDRRNRHSAQDLASLHGKTLRINDDGTIPQDNPFTGMEDVHPAIFSYGHRNSQGMARHPETRDIWQSEHGQSGGDEINILVKGANFGWPIATYGREYTTGRPIGVLPPEEDATVDPVYYWEPRGFPPAGIAFYQGDAFEQWQGDLFVAGLREKHLVRFKVNGREIVLAERLLENRGWRIRDVRVNPADGFLYLLVDDSDAPLVRMMPRPEENR